MARRATDMDNRVKQAGWIVTQTTKGHRRYINPETGARVIHSGSPGGGRGDKNCVAELRRAGLGVNPPARRTAREDPGTNAYAVLKALQDSGVPLDANGIIERIEADTGLRLENRQVHAALHWLVSRPANGVRRVSRGLYHWAVPAVEPLDEPALDLGLDADHDPVAREPDRTDRPSSAADPLFPRLSVVSDVPLPEPVNVVTPTEPGNLIHLVPGIVPPNLPAMFEAVTTDQTGALILRDENGRIWRATLMVPSL